MKKHLKYILIALVVGVLLWVIYQRYLAPAFHTKFSTLSSTTASTQGDWRTPAADQEMLFNGWVLRQHRYAYMYGGRREPFTLPNGQVYDKKAYWEYNAFGALAYFGSWLRYGYSTSRDYTLGYWRKALCGFSAWKDTHPELDGFPTKEGENALLPYLLMGWLIHNYFPSDMTTFEWTSFIDHSKYVSNTAYSAAGYINPWTSNVDTEVTYAEENALWAAIYRLVALVNGYSSGNTTYDAAYRFAGHAYTRNRTWQGRTTSTVRLVYDLPSAFNLIYNRVYLPTPNTRLSSTPNYNMGTALYLGYYQVASRYNSSEYAAFNYYLYWQSFYDQIVNTWEIDEAAGKFRRDGGSVDTLDLDALPLPPDSCAVDDPHPYDGHCAPFYYSTPPSTPPPLPTPTPTPDPYCVDEWGGWPIHGSAAYAAILNIIDKCNGSYKSDIQSAYQTLLNGTAQRQEAGYPLQRLDLLKAKFKTRDQNAKYCVIPTEPNCYTDDVRAKYLLFDGANHTLAMLLLEYR